MIALFLILASNPLEPLWALVDEERYEAAIDGALTLAKDGRQTESMRHQALMLALNAACSDKAERCNEIAVKLSDWAPLWRPDRRAQPTMVQAVGRARLARTGRHNRLPSGSLDDKQWCAPNGAVEVLLISGQNALKEEKRERQPCIDVSGIAQAFLLGYDADLMPVAVWGSVESPATLRPKNTKTTASLGLVAGIGGVLVAGLVAYLLLADEGSGQVQLTVVSTP